MTATRSPLAEHVKSAQCVTSVGRETFDDRFISAFRAAFAQNAFVDLTLLIDADVRATVAREVTRALDVHSVRRDMRVPATGESPRHYRVASRDALLAHCPAAAALYRAPELTQLLAEIAAEDIVPVPYAPEEVIATRLERAGDTHGWHWDDYAFALVWVLRSPNPADGAVLEYCANVPWCKDAPDLDAILAARTPRRAALATGTVYLLRTDTTLHRVSPLRCDGVRDALCFSYAAARDLQRVVTHETLDAILASGGNQS